MPHINIKLNLLGLPKAQYTSFKGVEGSFIVIPADTAFMTFEKNEKDPSKPIANIPLRIWQKPSDRVNGNAPTHDVSLNVSEEYSKSMFNAIFGIVNAMTDEAYNAFLQKQFQNRNGNATMPKTREDACKWYVTRSLRIGAGWEDKPKAPVAQQFAAELTPAPTPVYAEPSHPTPPQQDANPFASDGDQLPF